MLPLLRDGERSGRFCALGRALSGTSGVLVVSGFPTIVEGDYARMLYLFPGMAKALLGWPRTTFVVHEFVDLQETERRWLVVALKAADRIIAVSEAERDALLARYPWAASRTVVRHNAPKTSVATHDPAADARMRETLASHGHPVIAFFGHIMGPKKGFDELLQALARIDATLVATGSLDTSDPYMAYVRGSDRAARPRRARTLAWVSGARGVGRVLRVADAVVLPYHGGAKSGYTSLLAALVNGAAVITTRGPENPPWLRNGETALLVDSVDPATLASAIERMLEGASTSRRVCGLERASLEFGWDEIVEAAIAPAPRTCAASVEKTQTCS